MVLEWFVCCNQEGSCDNLLRIRNRLQGEMDEE